MDTNINRWSESDVFNLSDTLRSRRVNTSIANLCLLLKSDSRGFFDVPRVNHHFVDENKLYRAVGNVSSLVRIFTPDVPDCDDSGQPLPISPPQTSLVIGRILSDVVVCGFKVNKSLTSLPLYNCVSSQVAFNGKIFSCMYSSSFDRTRLSYSMQIHICTTVCMYVCMN